MSLVYFVTTLLWVYTAYYDIFLLIILFCHLLVFVVIRQPSVIHISSLLNLHRIFYQLRRSVTMLLLIPIKILTTFNKLRFCQRLHMTNEKSKTYRYLQFHKLVFDKGDINLESFNLETHTCVL